MIEYTLGFAFTEDRQYTLLMRKSHPEWQAGKLNGVGGELEEGETPLECMRREWIEETGGPASDGPDIDWEPTINLVCPGDWLVHCFRSFITRDMMREIALLTRSRDEPCLVVSMATKISGVSHLAWMLPLFAHKDMFSEEWLEIPQRDGLS